MSTPTSHPAANIEAPPEAVDKIYAQALFELVEKQGGRALLEEINDEMEQLEEARARDPKVREFFRSRIISAGDKERVLGAGFKAHINPLLMNFVLLLARKERLDRTYPIFTAFDQMLQERFGRVEVDVYSRFPLSAEDIESIRATLASVMKREPVVHAYVDDKMIGGLRIQVGDKMLDATVDANLRRMRERIVDRGGGALRERIDRMFGE